MRPKLEERARARELRGAGWSLRRIANELGVSISSVSVWVRNIVVPAAEASAASDPPPPIPSGDVKICGRCRRELPVEQFSRHREYGRQHWCKECFLAYLRARGGLHLRQTAESKRRRLAEARAFIDDYLRGHPCADCGETDPLVLEFDHLEQKDATVSKLTGYGWSIKRIRREIELCEVVCVNCHRRRTAARDPSWWRNDPSSLDTNPLLLRGERRNMQLVRDTLIACRCIDCGLDDLLVLEFDHVGPKRGNVLTLAKRGCSLMILEREMAGCEIRCGNCHRRRTRRSNMPRRAA